jgi:hypothetical protein
MQDEILEEIEDEIRKCISPICEIVFSEGKVAVNENPKLYIVGATIKSVSLPFDMTHLVESLHAETLEGDISGREGVVIKGKVKGRRYQLHLVRQVA